MDSVRTAVVTGGDRGMGEATCRRFLDLGYRVISVSLEAPAVTHPNLIGLTADLTDRAQIARAAETIAGYRPTTIVHNAGVVRAAPLEEVGLEDLDALVDLYFTATIVLTQACLSAMKAEGFGRIVLISSRAAVGLATRTVYTATKAGMIGLARTWALELGPHGITVNAVAPGPVATRMFTDVIPEGSETSNRLIQSLPMRRLGQPDDIARAVGFFADPQNSFVTGQTLFVCGGASVGSLQI